MINRFARLVNGNETTARGIMLIAAWASAGIGIQASLKN